MQLVIVNSFDENHAVHLNRADWLRPQVPVGLRARAGTS